MGKVVYKYNNVYASPYDCEIIVKEKNIEFYFSSTNNSERFKEKLLKINERIEKNVKKVYDIEEVDLELVALFKTYQETEKKGFRVVALIDNEKVVFKCRTEIRLNLRLEKDLENNLKI